MDVQVSRPMLCQFPLEMPYNASAFADVVSVVYSECGNHFHNRNIVSAGTKNHYCSGVFVKLVIFINHIHV